MPGVRAAALGAVLAGLLAPAAAPPAAAAAPVRVGWPVAAGAVVRPGQALAVRVVAARRPSGRRALADVALLAVARSGRARAVLARRRARRAVVAVRVPRDASGRVRLRVRVAGRSLARDLRIAAPPAPPAPPAAPAPAPPAAPPDVTCAATAGSALTAAAVPAVARPGERVGLLVRNTGATCLTGGICPEVEALGPGGAWGAAAGVPTACPAVAIALRPGAEQRFDAVLPAEARPGTPHRLRLALNGPDGALDAVAPVEVLP